MNMHTSPKKEYDFPFKIAIVGDSGVGKTALFSCYNTGTFTKDEVAKTGLDWADKLVDLYTRRTVKAEIWDTTGQGNFRFIIPDPFYINVGAVIVYSLTNLESFISVKKWIEDLKESAGDDNLLVGNKLDLCEWCPELRKVSTERGKEFASENRLLFMETTAFPKTKDKDVFELIIEKLVRKAEIEIY